MKTLTAIVLSALFFISLAQDAPKLAAPAIATNRDTTIRVAGATQPYLTIERSTNALTWEPLTTISTNTPQYSDSGAVYRSAAIYRAQQFGGSNVLTGDALLTDNGVLTFHPVNHASFVMSWNGLTIYNDPVGGAALYASFPRADLILVSHEHTVHFDNTTLKAVRKASGTVLLTTRTVYNTLSSDLKTISTVLTNGAGTNVFGIQIDAVPAYNSNHPKGTGNGYILTIGGKRVYMTGDTGALNEMKAIPAIDVAFVCMNVPFTMTVPQAGGIVRQFAPLVVYPYHFQNQDKTFSDLNAFRQQVGTDLGIEVRARKWY